MNIPDGANRDYSGKKGIFYAWGWIGNKIPKSEHTWESDEIKNTFLKLVDSVPNIDGFMGRHNCEICNERLGCCSKKFKYNNKVYVCPDKVEHYILVHNYIPLQEVIDAVLNGIESQENQTYKKNHEGEF